MSKSLVIIPHFNKLILLKECLYHLEKQNYNNFDILIIDNGSIDGSPEYIFKKSSENNKYHNILLNENTGFAYAVNRGFEYSLSNGYDYSILINNDVYVENDFIKELVYNIKNSYKVFAVSAMMINYHDKDVIDSFGDYYNVLGWSFQGHVGEKVNSMTHNENCFSACGGAAIYDNEILKKVGLLDENFFAYLEDIDLSYRAKLLGYKIKNCFSAKCYHLGSATSGSKYNEFKVRISARNNIYLIYKNMPNFQIIINILPLSLGIFVKLIFFIMKGLGLDYFFGLFDGFKNLKYIKKNYFNKSKFLVYLKMEIELCINTIKYCVNFMNRHI